MGALIFKKMDIKVKIALVYSVIIIIMGIGVAVFLSLAVKYSMKNQPVTQSIAYVTSKAYGGGDITDNETEKKSEANKETEKKDKNIYITQSVKKKSEANKETEKSDTAICATPSQKVNTASYAASEEGDATMYGVTADSDKITYGVADKEADTSYTVAEKRKTDTEITISFKQYGAVTPGQYNGNISITGDQLDQFLSSEIFKRLIRYSAIAVFIMLVSIFFIGYNVSKWLLKPLTSMAGVTHQITAEKLDLRLSIPESNDELHQLSNSFNTTLDGLQEAFLELERFNAYASHELKNALAVLKTRLEVDYRETDCRETTGFAIAQVNKISKSINDILAISSTSIKDSSELVDIAMAAAEVADEYRVTGREIVLDIPEEGVLPVRGKEIWFQRVIANLVDNAIKHSDAVNSIHIKVKQDFEAIIVSVSDSGRGITGSEQEHIWEPYFSTSPGWEKGYGLGLAMVNHIVDICGGLVWVDSKEGKGSTFYISLPAARS
jgi:signal transduction histidine kinase